jgi:hypothetical protein
VGKRKRLWVTQWPHRLRVPCQLVQRPVVRGACVRAVGTACRGAGGARRGAGCGSGAARGGRRWRNNVRNADALGSAQPAPRRGAAGGRGAQQRRLQLHVQRQHGGPLHAARRGAAARARPGRPALPLRSGRRRACAFTRARSAAARRALQARTLPLSTACARCGRTQARRLPRRGAFVWGALCLPALLPPGFLSPSRSPLRPWPAVCHTTTVPRRERALAAFTSRPHRDAQPSGATRRDAARQCCQSAKHRIIDRTAPHPALARIMCGRRRDDDAAVMGARRAA